MPDPGIARAARLRRLAGVLCLVVAAAGAGYLWLRSSGSTAPTPEKSAAAAQPAPTALPAAAEVPTALPVVVVPTPPRVRRAASELKAAAPRQAAPVASNAGPVAPPGSASASTSTQAPAPAHAPRSAAGPRTYAGSVALPGGEKIELGGIAWSEEEPRALLNDRIVGVGGYVDGYSVSKIETDRVVLEKDGATIVLTVK
jgi:hypothetical protein